MADKDKTISENIKVYIRLRPFLSVEEQEASSIDSDSCSGVIKKHTEDGRCVYYSNVRKKDQAFKFDGFITPAQTQEYIFETVARGIVDSAISGYSGTILAYGPTNSGKTYTMQGAHIDDAQEKGVLPRTIEYLLSSLAAVDGAEIWVSYLQIYCEVISDLINPSSPEANTADPIQLSIREKGDGNVYVEGLSRTRVTKREDLIVLLDKGDRNRSTAQTQMNDTSSRSHAALVITLLIPDSSNSATGDKDTPRRMYKESSLVLVDLAGSERASATAGMAHQRSEEGRAINLSLSALGNCMNALAEGRQHIPYRDSKLTRLLQSSLGGNSRTAVIVNLPPGPDENGEVVSSLRFASRACRVKVSAKISRCLNYESMYADALKQLQELKSVDNDAIVALERRKQLLEDKDSEIEALREQLKALRGEVEYLRGSGAGDTSAGASASKDGRSAGDGGNWQAELQLLTEKHLQDLDAQRRKYDAKIGSYQRGLNEAKQEVSSLQDELHTERSRHLATVKELKGYSERMSRTESAADGRVQELIAEITDKDGVIEDMQDALGASSELIKTFSESAEAAQSRYEELAARFKDCYSKEQVAEIEGKFMETVTRLTARVMQLETKSSSVASNENDEDEDGVLTSASYTAAPSWIGGAAALAGKRQVTLQPGRVVPPRKGALW